MSSTFWVAKYIDDPFRNEPKNVGIFVQVSGRYATKFLGEREDGVLDGRLIRGHFAHPTVYTQWRDFWKESIAVGDIKSVLAAVTSNYLVATGGEVSGTEGDTADEVCSYLFDLIVSGGRVALAYRWDENEVRDKNLGQEISESFLEMNLLATGETLLAPHPIVREMEVNGEQVKHRPSFCQKNGHLSVFEYIDLGSPKGKLVRERAGWMAYMFDDITTANKDAQTFSIVRPEKDDSGDVIDYARTVLAKTSEVVNWSDTNARRNFLQERKRLALSLG